MAKNLWPQRLIELLDVAPIRFPDVLPGSALIINATKDGFEWGTQGGAGPQGPQGEQGEPGPPNILTIGSVIEGAEPSATITGTSPEQVLNLVLPKGDPGTNGTNGTDGTSAVNPNFTIGSVSSGVVPGVALTGAYPDLELSFQLVKGDTGEEGPAGAPNVLSIGTVSVGTPASATITGDSPTQVLNLVLPPGPPGPGGDGLNVGTGVGLFKQLNVNGFLEFFTLLASGGVTLEQSGDQVTVGFIGSPSADFGADKVIAPADCGTYFRSTATTASTVTFPSGLSLVLGAEVHIRQAGSGAVTLVAGSGVTLNAPFGGTLVLAGEGATVTAKYVAADTWDVIGLVEAAP